jgi:YD repeat-containing protein
VHYRYLWHTTSVTQQDGTSTGCTWTGNGKRQEETGIKQQYDTCAYHVQRLQWPFDIGSDVTSIESCNPFQGDSRGEVWLLYEEVWPTSLG